MISAKIKTGEARIYITSYKILAFKEQKKERCISSDGEAAFSNNNRSVSVTFTSISQGWYGWVGLVISNEGVFPRNIEKPDVVAPINISTSRFLYGQFRAPGMSGVWGDVDICMMTSNLVSSGNPFPGSVDMDSIYLQPGYKAIVWVFLNYTGVEDLSSVSITISIAG
ncbi:hypothetical protein ATG_18260 [Desulfurococcaceae archaeon AG1]|nr:hypothetical protein ATG_18260 [Desulfurococcaceae archaeon AG1]